MGKHSVEKAIEHTSKKYKKRMKRTCYCGILWILIAVLSLIIGIALLVYFAKYWGDQRTLKRGLAYLGVALLIFFLLSLAIAIILFIAMRIIYLRLEGSGDSGMKKMFKPPSYPPGEAPYPQQPVDPGVPGMVPPANPGLEPPHQPSQPPEPSAPPGNLADINVEVSEHHKF